MVIYSLTKLNTFLPSYQIESEGTLNYSKISVKKAINPKKKKKKFLSGHYLRSKDKLNSNILVWTPTHGHTSVGQPAETYIYLLCAVTRCCLKELPHVMANRDRWQKS